MAWSNEEISQFQIDNNKALAEVNATLRPDEGLEGRCGIFCQGQMGDLMTCMSILRYRKEIFGNKKIIWYANFPNAEALKFSPISEVRPWPWAGNGLSIGTPDFYPMLCNENNKLNKELARQYELTSDLDDGYFPAAWQLVASKRHGLDYPNVSKKVFGIPDDYQWHPVLEFSDEEKMAAFNFMERFAHKKSILFETFAGSSQSILSEVMINDAMNKCREIWPGCIFIFASHKYLRGNEKFPEHFFDQQGVYSCAEFTVRQCAIFNDYVDLIISVSSGIMVACSHWGRLPTPVEQFCGSFVCSTKSLIRQDQPFELVTADNKTPEAAKQEFEERLISLLNKYK